MDDFNWDDVRIAYQAAKLGSLSKAAAQCGVNYSTILRRIEQLETALGCKLFYRHQRGYQLTDAGRKLLSDLPEIETRFSKLQSSLMGEQNVIYGNIKITILPEYSAFLHPILLKCQRLYPQLRLQVDVSNDILPLENGSAHISIRACENGDMQADLIAYKIKKLEYSYYASSDYVANRGLPKSSIEYNAHSWVMPSGNKRKISFIKDMDQMIEQKNIAYQSNHFFDIQSAVEHGIGIGPIDDAKVAVNSGLQKVNSIVCNNENYLWFVYHKDLRDDLKIKAVAQLIKAQTQCEVAATLRFLDEER